MIKMRVKNSFYNISMAIVSQVIIALLGFISRKIFLDSLGTEYLGINGLLTSVLGILGLIESGIGISIVYSLYKPLAMNYKEEIIALVQLYKKAYRVISLVVFFLSIIIFPIVLWTIDTDIPTFYIFIIYSIFVFKNIVTYLFAYKFCIINADQKGYILSRNNLIFNVLMMILRIAVLTITQNYLFYLIIELLGLIIQNIVNCYIVNKRYPYLLTKKKYVLDEYVKESIVGNVKAIFLHNIGSYCVFGTDNILISTMVNVSTVGLYSNYTLITGQLVGIISPIINGLSHSIGNLLTDQDNKRSYSIFNVIYLINFWIYSIAVIFLYNLLEGFICWWIGEAYLLNTFVFIAILVNIYITGMRNSILIFKTKSGIFQEDKYFPLIESSINLVSSIILAKYLGLLGIILGTTISTLSIVFWNVPRLVYKNVFNMPVVNYFKKYLMYTILTILVCWVTSIICNYFTVGYSLNSLIIRGVICMIIPNIVYVILFSKTIEFQYLKTSILSLVPISIKKALA